MKITFLGAAKTVTGSCYLVETSRTKLLVDCGMFQGRSSENALNNENFYFNPASIDYLLLTHAHIDHSGRIPKLFADGFKGDIISTKATAELCAIMLPDSGHIQEFENEWENRKRMRAGKPPVKPLYTVQDAISCLKLFKPVKYFESIRLNDEIVVKFNDAGHILGSAILEMWVFEDDKTTKIVFSGDLGNKNMPILRDPSIIADADFVVIESTYGNRLHEARGDNTERFVDIILNTIERGGNVVIPSFAVGRTQEIIYDLYKQKYKLGDKFDKLMSVPVVVDSPLAISATQIFRNNLDCYDDEARSYVEKGDNPLELPKLRFTVSAEESKALNDEKEGMIIISASGMCEAGRIKHHLKHNLWRKESTVIFVGYQAQGTLGRRLVDGAKRVKIFGEEIAVNAEIVMMEGFSGHADMNGLLNWLQSFHNKPIKVFATHGETEASENFASLVRNKLGIDCVVPSRGDSYILKGRSAYETVKGYRGKQQYDNAFISLEILDYIDRLKEEFDEMSEAIVSDLKKEKSDIELEEIFARLKIIEKALTQVL